MTEVSSKVYTSVSTYSVSTEATPFDANVVEHVDSTGKAVIGTDLSVAQAGSTFREGTGVSLTEVATNVLRSEPKGVLREDSTTNRILYNEDLTNAAWNLSNNCATPTQTGSPVDPEGGNGAWKIAANAANNAYFGQDYGTAQSNSGVVWVHRGNTDECSISVFDNSGPTQVLNVNVDVSTNGWKKVELEGFSAPGDALVLSPGYNGVANSASDGDYFWVYAPCLFDLDVATSPITTTTTAVTRADDTLTGSVANLPAWNTAFTVALTFRLKGLPSGVTNGIWYASGETSRRQTIVLANGTLRSDMGGNNLSSSTGTVVADTEYRLVYTTDGTNYFQYLDGVQKGATGTNAAPSGTATAIEYGLNGNIHIKDVKIYNRYFTAAEAKYA